MKWTLVSTVIVVAVSMGFLYFGGQSSAKQPLGSAWPTDRLVSMDRIEHAAYDALLQKYVDQDGFVNYRGWSSHAQDRQALRDYLSQLSLASLSAPARKESQLAFWINAYNAVTLEGILMEYPTDSIRNHTAKIGGYNIWDDLPLIVGGKKFSLNDIEHKVLRKMSEPRIHFAIVCASIGCPRLLNAAYVPAKLEEQLVANAQDFFSRPQNFMIDDSGTIYLSSILDWFGADFGDSQQARMTYLQPYLPEPTRQMAISTTARVSFQNYNWTLNDQSRKPVPGSDSGSGSH